MDATPVKAAEIAQTVTFEGRALHAALKIAAAIAPKVGSFPILSYALISVHAEQTGVEIRVTDLDRTLILTVDELDSCDTWTACLPVHQVSAIASIAGSAAVSIKIVREVIAQENPKTKELTYVEQVKANITIDEVGASYTIAGRPADDFPDQRDHEFSEVERFTNGMLIEAFRRVSWAISKDDTRYYLNGICWKRGEEGSRFVATNGHVLASYHYDREPNAATSDIIPREAITFLMKYLPRADVRVFVGGVNRSVIEFRATGLRFQTKLIDGTFPDTDRVTSGAKEDARFPFIYRSAKLLADIERATVFSSSWRRAVEFSNNDGATAIRVRDDDYGESRVITRCEWPEGAISVGFNGDYLKQALRSCHGDVTLWTSDKGGPATILDQDESMLRIVMPMRV